MLIISFFRAILRIVIVIIGSVLAIPITIYRVASILSFNMMDDMFKPVEDTSNENSVENSGENHKKG